MKNNKLEKNLEKARINLYNILAILIVIIPEYLAELQNPWETIQNICVHSREALLKYRTVC